MSEKTWHDTYTEWASSRNIRYADEFYAHLNKHYEPPIPKKDAIRRCAEAWFAENRDYQQFTKDLETHIRKHLVEG